MENPKKIDIDFATLQPHEIRNLLSLVREAGYREGLKAAARVAKNYLCGAGDADDPMFDGGEEYAARAIEEAIRSLIDKKD